MKLLISPCDWIVVPKSAEKALFTKKKNFLPLKYSFLVPSALCHLATSSSSQPHHSFYSAIFTAIYRVSQEERTKLREGVRYVKLYRYDPKHLCPKLNGYWDNGQIKLCTSFRSTNDSCQLFCVICICSRMQHTNCWRSPEMHIPAYVRQAVIQAGWRHCSAFQCDV